MPDEQNPPPIYGYIFGKLTREERAELMRRALDDQSVFNEIWDSCDHRELLQDPAVRQRLLAALEDAPKLSPWDSAWQWLLGPVGRFALAGTAILCLAVLLLYGPWKPGGEETLTLVTNPSSDFTDLFKLPLRNPAALRLDFHQVPAVYRPGDIVHATVLLNRTAAVFVLRRGPRGPARLVFPGNLITPADRNPGEIALSFDPAPPTEDVTARRRYVLRVIALPPGVDLRTQSIDWARLGRDSYSVTQTNYDVVP